MQHLGDEAIIDEDHKATVTLSREEATRREELVEDVEYFFQLALNKGDYYLGSATINFYLKEELPQLGELFINSQAMAISDLTINDQEVKENTAFRGQKIALEATMI